MARRRLATLVLAVCLLAGCQAGSSMDLPDDIRAAATQFCAESGYRNVLVGKSTHQLTQPEIDAERHSSWCVEVQFERFGRPGKAAVLVVQGLQGASWQVQAPILSIDCMQHSKLFLER